MPIQAPRWGFGGLLTPECDYSSSRPPKGTSLRKSASFKLSTVKIRWGVWPVGDQSINQKKIRVTKVTMLLRDHYYSANKWRIIEIKKFSIGAGTTAVLVPKRLCHRHEWVVPGIAARYREELRSSVASWQKVWRTHTHRQIYILSMHSIGQTITKVWCYV